MEDKLKEVIEESKYVDSEYVIDSEHFDWLIKQTERYEKLRIKWNDHIDDRNKVVEDYNDLVEQITEVRKERDYWKEKCLLLQRQ